MSTVKDNLVALRDFLTEDKWCKGKLVELNGIDIGNFDGDPNCKFCIVGAMRRIKAYDSKTIHFLDRVIFDCTSIRGVTTFNDDPKTTYLDVQLILKEAIERAESL